MKTTLRQAKSTPALETSVKSERNFVAKYAHEFNKHMIHKKKKGDFKRKPKHPKKTLEEAINE